MRSHAWLSPLKEELLRARELEAAGKEHLDAQEKRVARLKVANVRNPQSERLLRTMRDTHNLQASHVQLLEEEVREASEALSVREVSWVRAINALPPGRS